MVSKQYIRRLALGGVTAVFLFLLFSFWQTQSVPSRIQAAAKSPRLNYAVFAPPHSESAAREIFEEQFEQPNRESRAYTFIQAVPLGAGEARAWQTAGCTADTCAHVTFYDLDRRGTLEGVVNLETHKLIDVWANADARPGASAHTLETALAIAAADARVRAVLGDISAADVMMVPMNIWLLDDGCNRAWCVDLTFHDPAGSGRIFHATVNMHTQQVARTFYTRGRAPIPYVDIPSQRDAFRDGCHEQGGWQVCWEMTAHDGLNFYDATYNGRSIFSTAKVGQVEVWYPSWPGGYRDEIGFAASVPPYFGTEIEEVEGGFQVRQLFTEFVRWPNCICCYRYEQIIAFYDDGAFEARFVSHGPGCDELSVYQPVWRIDLDLGNATDDAVWVWERPDENPQWREVAAEQAFELVGETAPDGQKLATFDGDLHYRWRYVPTDPLGLDEAKLFLLNWREGEGDNPIQPGAANTFEPPSQWIDADALSGENIVMWYVPLLKTKKGGPWWCMPEPAPEMTPCEAILRAEPGGPLPSPEELAAQPVETAESATPEPAPTRGDTPPAGGETPVATAAPPEIAGAALIEGESVVELFLNAGCTACHVIGDLGEHNKVGPDLSNIGSVAHQRVPALSAGEYVRRSILYPNEFIAPECPNGPCLSGIMPTYYGERLMALQLEQMVAYLLEQTGQGSNPVEPTPSPAPIGEAATPAPTPTVPRISRIVEPSAAGQTFSLVVWLLFGLGVVFLLALSQRRK